MAESSRPGVTRHDIRPVWTVRAEGLSVQSVRITSPLVVDRERGMRWGGCAQPVQVDASSLERLPPSPVGVCRVRGRDPHRMENGEWRVGTMLGLDPEATEGVSV